MPVYDKPMIYYPLSVLMLAGIREVLIITTPQDQPSFQRLLRDAGQWGMALHSAVQPEPGGLAHASTIVAAFVACIPSSHLLGVNNLHVHGLPQLVALPKLTNPGSPVYDQYRTGGGQG